MSKLLITAVFTAVFFSFPLYLPAQDYLLGPRDVLNINVYDHQDLETRSRITKDGKITFPLLGEIQVSGLSVQELERKLTSMLADGYIIKPHVSVFVEEFRVVVYVTGEVENPGSYPFIDGMTAIKAISVAGGITDKGAESQIKVTRKLSGGLQETTKLGIHGILRPNDVLQVPLKKWIYVTGEVKKPGSYLFDERITILKAVTLAGGFTDKAAPGRSKIIRKQIDGREISIRVSMEDELLPEDVVVIPESYF